MAEARALWKANQSNLDPARLVFIDETGANTKMVRTHARAPRGQRALARQPFGHWKTTTFTAALRQDGLTAPMVLDGPMNRGAFLVYVDKVLGPTLKPGDIVIMDNLPAHKGDQIKALIEARDARLMFLPPYSPDLNPWPSRSSRHCSEKPQSEPSQPCGTASAALSKPSRPKNAQTTSAMMAMRQLKRRLLYDALSRLLADAQRFGWSLGHLAAETQSPRSAFIRMTVVADAALEMDLLESQLSRHPSIMDLRAVVIASGETESCQTDGR